MPPEARHESIPSYIVLALSGIFVLAMLRRRR